MEQTKFKKTNRITIIGFLVIFTVPIIMAWIAYFNGWFEGVATTNKGEWVQPILELSEFNPVYSDDKPVPLKPGETWKLIYPAKVSECQSDQGDSICMINLFLIGQTHMALGKESERVERVLFNGPTDYEPEQLKALQERFIDLRVVNSNSNRVLDLSTDYIYIADPVGNIMLRYKVVEKKENVFLKGKDILKDMKNLLKLSRLD